MTEIFVNVPAKGFAPSCESCGANTRIFGIEPHIRLAHTDIHTYVCDACDETQIVVVPLPNAG